MKQYVWKTKNGKKISINEMNSNHLRNTITFLKKKLKEPFAIDTKNNGIYTSDWITIMRKELDLRL